jgi:two-component system, OmpR family, sensor histidine kinase KdpD
MRDSVSVTFPSAASARSGRPTRPGLTRGRRRLGLALVAIVLPSLTAVLVQVRGDLTLGSVLLLYVLAVVVISVVGGLVAGVIAAIASFVLANYFLTSPYRTLAVNDRDSVIELVVFLLVSVTVSVLVDLAARRQSAAQQLDEVDRLRSALLAAVGHDLRTPLAEIKAAVTTLRQTNLHLEAADQAELLGSIEHSTDLLTDLIANLLDLSRLQAGALSMDLQAVALDEVVSRALIDRRFGDVANDVDDDLPMAYADAGLLERVVANLVDNAHRHSPAGSRVEVRGRAGDGSVQIAVVDHGVGVSDGDWDKMFVPFQRLHDRSTDISVGLGLAIARGFTDAMGGSVTPSHSPGGGLTMTVTLRQAEQHGGGSR